MTAPPEPPTSSGDRPDPAPGGDPGWPPPSLRGVLAALVPGMLGRFTDDPDVPVVVVMRRVFLGFVSAPVVIALVLLLVVRVPGPLDDDPVVWLLLIAGAMSTIGGTDAVRRRRIVCGDRAQLARQVSSMTFLAVATANTSVLTGFVAAFRADAVWPYLLGVVPTVIALTWAAPTRRRIQQLDRRLQHAGCAHTVSEVVYARSGDAASPPSGDEPPRSSS